MTKREFVSIALKLLAIYAAIIAINTGVSAVTQVFALSRPGFLTSLGIPPQAQYMTLLPLLAQIGIAIFLWLFAEGLSVSIVREDGVFAGGVSLNEVKSVAFSVVGVWLASNALVDFVQQFTNRSLSGYSASDQAGFTSAFIAAALQFLIGVSLIYGARNLVRVLTSPRDWGRKNIEDE